MDAGGNFGTNFALYLMMIICVVLVGIDSIELFRLGNDWSRINAWSMTKFQSCITIELITKTTFAIFSLLSAIAALALTIFITINTELFLQKILAAYLNLVYAVFGPIMLGFAILGLANWNDVAFTCDKSNPQNKIFSFGSAFSLIGCFILSLLITLTFVIYEIVNLYINSILGRDDQNKILRTCFWWVVTRARPNITGNQQNNNNNENNNQNNNRPDQENEERININPDVNRN
jgi:hypothetical protein